MPNKARASLDNSASTDSPRVVLGMFRDDPVNAAEKRGNRSVCILMGINGLIDAAASLGDPELTKVLQSAAVVAAGVVAKARHAFKQAKARG